MAPEKVNTMNKFLAWSGWAVAVMGCVYTLGGKGVDTVNFVTKTKETNADYPEFKKTIINRLDTFSFDMHDLKKDFRDFKTHHEKMDEVTNANIIKFNSKTIEAINSK